MQEEARQLRCRVKRNGQVCTLPVEQLVLGDIVLLEAGESIPADGILLTGTIAVDQSALTGESREENKRAGGTHEPQRWSLEDTRQVFRGTLVTSGQGVMVVMRVGASTFLGGVAGQLGEQVRESPLKLRLEHLARLLSRIGYGAAVLVCLADLFYGFVLQNNFDPDRKSVV